jgi:hypothetical protein
MAGPCLWPVRVYTRDHTRDHCLGEAAAARGRSALNRKIIAETKGICLLGFVTWARNGNEKQLLSSPSRRFQHGVTL